MGSKSYVAEKTSKHVLHMLPSVWVATSPFSVHPFVGITIMEPMIMVRMEPFGCLAWAWFMDPDHIATGIMRKMHSRLA